MSSNPGQQVERAVVDLLGGAEGPDELDRCECHGRQHRPQPASDRARSVVHAATVGSAALRRRAHGAAATATGVQPAIDSAAMSSPADARSYRDVEHAMLGRWPETSSTRRWTGSPRSAICSANRSGPSSRAYGQQRQGVDRSDDRHLAAWPGPENGALPRVRGVDDRAHQHRRRTAVGGTVRRGLPRGAAPTSSTGRAGTRCRSSRSSPGWRSPPSPMPPSTRRSSSRDGGSWDATNVADGSVAVLTPIAVSHSRYLGNRSSRAKAGIIKAGAFAVIGQQQVEVAEVLLGEPWRSVRPWRVRVSSSG